MTQQEQLLRQLYACRFYNWELEQAPYSESIQHQQALEQSRAQLKQLYTQYKTLYGEPDSAEENISRWAWTAGPWPPAGEDKSAPKL